MLPIPAIQKQYVHVSLFQLLSSSAATKMLYLFKA